VVRIYVDEREKSSGVPEILRGLGVTVIYRRLDVGDYIVSDRTAIERKTADDFIKSLIDGRLFDQCRRLSDVYEKPVLLIEGSLRRALSNSSIRRNAVIGALTTLIVDLDVHVLFTYNAKESAFAIKSIAEKEQRSGRSYVVLHKKPKLSSLREWQLYILQSLPYVGPKVAQRLLETFGSVYRVFTATVPELAKIEGLGEKKAGEVVRIIRAPYTPEKERRSQARSIIDYLLKNEENTSSSQ